MTDSAQNTPYDVIIIGAGPSGIAAALELKMWGVNNVIILERETQAGGATRHCGHPPFGIREYKRILTGPVYAKKLAETATKKGIHIAFSHSVTELAPGGHLTVASPAGTKQLAARRVLIATGIRETPRSARLVSGDRALGICNTGTLQSMFYLKKLIPFRNPVVVGSEIVSFSALSTCKKAGIQPVAMLEESDRPTVRSPIHYATRYFNVPLLLNTRISKIIGHDRVEAVQIVNQFGAVKTLTCDGILFTGKFTPESTLARMGHLVLNAATDSPAVDATGRCSDPTYYAAGNVVQHAVDSPEAAPVPLYYNADNLPQPVNVAGQCWADGQRVARSIASDLNGTATRNESA
jgi:thioredoxin reductase